MGKCDNPAAMLKKRVVIQNVSRSPDGQGGFTETWANESTVWASIDPMKAYERFQAGQSATPVTHKIVMRYNRTLTSTSRLKYGDRYFGVKEVLNRNEDSRFLDIRAIELESVAAEEDTTHLLLESGFAFLLEDGSNLLLEAA